MRFVKIKQLVGSIKQTRHPFYDNQFSASPHTVGNCSRNRFIAQTQTVPHDNTCYIKQEKRLFSSCRDSNFPERQGHTEHHQRSVPYSKLGLYALIIKEDEHYKPKASTQNKPKASTYNKPKTSTINQRRALILNQR